MSKTLTCLACGQTGPDVRTTLVEYRDPIPVEVAIPIAYDRKGRVLGNDVRTVPGRYGAEWRCQDRAACEERIRPAKPEPVSKDISDEEAVAFL